MDAIINIKKKLPFQDYPTDREDGLSDMGLTLADAEGVGEFLGEMQKRTFQLHDAFSVGEVFNEKEEEIPDFIGDNGYFSSIFDFSTTSWGKTIKAGMRTSALLLMRIKNAILTHRREPVTLALFQYY